MQKHQILLHEIELTFNLSLAQSETMTYESKCQCFKVKVII